MKEKYPPKFLALSLQKSVFFFLMVPSSSGSQKHSIFNYHRQSVEFHILYFPYFLRLFSCRATVCLLIIFIQTLHFTGDDAEVLGGKQLHSVTQLGEQKPKPRTPNSRAWSLATFNGRIVFQSDSSPQKNTTY